MAESQPIPTDPRFKNIAGHRSGIICAVSYAGPDPRGVHQLWNCLCDCGREIVKRANDLLSGHVKSCGCLKRARNARGPKYRHGKAGSAEHRVWKLMRQRCSNPNLESYPDYGGRGIRVCERWNDFENFLADMGPRPSPQHTIERRDVNGNYCPENCYWLPKSQQTDNTRRTVRLTVGNETLTMSQWARRVGLSPSVIHNRLRAGWSHERAIMTPTLKSLERLHHSMKNTTP